MSKINEYLKMVKHIGELSRIMEQAAEKARPEPLACVSGLERASVESDRWIWITDGRWRPEEARALLD